MNCIEKILAAHSGESQVHPGQIIEVQLDYVMANDATACLAIRRFTNELKAQKVYDPNKVILVTDHYTPSSSVEAADSHNTMRQFAREQQLRHLYDGEGICHQLMLEHHVKPGQLIVGADSHTCSYGALGALGTGMGSTDISVAFEQGKIWMKVPQTINIRVKGKWPKHVSAKDLILRIIGDLTVQGATYKALTFTGPAICDLSISERITLCNMAIEAGAKFGFIPVDDVTQHYLKQVGRDSSSLITDDEDYEYEKTLEYDVDQLEPQVAKPHSVDNVTPVRSLDKTYIDEVFIGACTNGRYEDLEAAAAIIKGHRLAPGLRMIVTPASRDIYLKALENGLIATFVTSGASVTPPGCSTCFGGSGGILGKGEKLLTTANRNFRARVGSPQSEIYLASPAVAAATAITGYVTDPKEVA